MSRFGRTLIVGAAAATTLPLDIELLAPVLGAPAAVALHLVAAVAVWLATLASGARQRFAALCAALCLGLLAWSVAGSLAGLSLLLGGVAASLRTGWLCGPATVRKAATEVAILALATACGALLYQPGALGAALATWAWFVAQSLYFAVEQAPTRATRHRGDPFDKAADSLERLLAPH